MRRIGWPILIAFTLICMILRWPPNLQERPSTSATALLARVRVAQPVSGLTRVVLETKGKLEFFRQPGAESLPPRGAGAKAGRGAPKLK